MTEPAVVHRTVSGYSVAAKQLPRECASTWVSCAFCTGAGDVLLLVGEEEEAGHSDILSVLVLPLCVAPALLNIPGNFFNS